MDEQRDLAGRFEEHRLHLRGAAYRMLGSLSEADDAVQEAWLRLSRSDAGAVENLRGWLTTVVARVCLDMLRSRTARREEQVGAYVPDPIVTPKEGQAADPAQQAVLAESVGLALLVVLETLDPAERLAFVLHDMFAVPFEEIAPVVGRTPTAARQLASRARRRVQGAEPGGAVDVHRQREVVEAFLAASREGNFEALLEVLDPDVVLRLDRGPSAPADASKVVRGASAVAKLGFRFAGGGGWEAHPARVNGGAGVVITHNGRPFSVTGFTVRDGRIVGIDILADVGRVTRLDLPRVGG